MDCLNVQGSKANEPSLLNNHNTNQDPRSRRGDQLLKAVVATLIILFIVLLALFIWLAVEVRHNKNDIKSLRNSLVGTTQSATVQTASARGLGNATLSSVSTAYPAVYLSQNATAQSGYAYAGSLYRCGRPSSSLLCNDELNVSRKQTRTHALLTLPRMDHTKPDHYVQRLWLLGTPRQTPIAKGRLCGSLH